MRIYHHFNDLPADARGAAVAIGNFDGIHRGHQAVIDEAGRIARAAGLPWAVLTFEPHPRSIFKPDIEPFRLTPFPSKARHIEALGVDCLIVLEFDLPFSRWPANQFVDDVLVRGLEAHHVVSGYDFVFGHDREGNCELLLQLGARAGFGFTSVSAVVDGAGEIFSATRVRSELVAANPRAAAQLLGRFFEIEGRVEHGEKRGHTVGFPTANLHLDEILRPAKGVYAVRASVGDGPAAEWRDGVANLGHRPTFAGDDLILEVHLFDFDGDLYGQHLRVALVDYLRPEKKFDGLNDLKAQIVRDIEAARGILGAIEDPAEATNASLLHRQ
jgi:riboflavin kinase / FMN adenylyltransferase